jgi:hypothetical protein
VGGTAVGGTAVGGTAVAAGAGGLVGAGAAVGVAAGAQAERASMSTTTRIIRRETTFFFIFSPLIMETKIWIAQEVIFRNFRLIFFFRLTTQPFKERLAFFRVN